MTTFADFIDWTSVGDASVVTKDPLEAYNISGPAAIVPFCMREGAMVTFMRLVLWDERTADIQRIETQPWEYPLTGEIGVRSKPVSMGKYGHSFRPADVRPDQGGEIVRHMVKTFLTDQPLNIDPAVLVTEIRLVLIADGVFDAMLEAKITSAMPLASGKLIEPEIVTRPRIEGNTLRQINRLIRKHAPSGSRTRLRDGKFIRLPLDIPISLDPTTAHERMAAAARHAPRKGRTGG